MDGSNFFGITYAVVNTHIELHINIVKKFNGKFKPILKSSYGCVVVVSIDMVHTIYKDMPISDNKNTFVISCIIIIYTVYSTWVDPYPEKKAKLFEYA